MSKIAVLLMLWLFSGCYSDVNIALDMNHPTSEMGSGIQVYVIVEDQRDSDSEKYTNQDVTQLLKEEITTGLEARGFTLSPSGETDSMRVLYSKLTLLNFSSDHLDYFSGERPDYFTDEEEAIAGIRGGVKAQLVIQVMKQNEEYHKTYQIDQDLHVDGHVSEFYGQGIVQLLKELFADEALLQFLTSK